MQFIDKLHTRPPSPVLDQKLQVQHQRNVSAHEAQHLVEALDFWLRKQAPQRWVDGQHRSFTNNALSSPRTDDSRESAVTRNRSPLSDTTHVQMLRSTPPSTANPTPQPPSTNLKRKRSHTPIEDNSSAGADSRRKRARLGTCKQEPGHCILTRLRTRTMRMNNEEVQFHTLEHTSRKVIAYSTTVVPATTHQDFSDSIAHAGCTPSPE